MIIQAVRRRQGLTQAELARRAGTSQPVVSAYEHGHRDPTYATLRKLVEAGGERLQLPRWPPPPTGAAHRHRGARPSPARRAEPGRRRARATPTAGAGGTEARLQDQHPTLAQRIRAIDGALSDIPHAFGGALARPTTPSPRRPSTSTSTCSYPAARFAEVADRWSGWVPPPMIRRSRRWCSGTGRPGDVGRHAHRPLLLLRRRSTTRPRPAGWCPSPTGASPSWLPTTSSSARWCSTAPKDWVDIEAMQAAGAAVDAAEVLRWVGRIAGDEDPRYDRIATLLAGR